jgi:hypothetical protein
MPTKYDRDVKANAVRPVRDHASDYDMEWTAILAIRPISCGPVRAPLSLQDTTVPHPAKFYRFTCRSVQRGLAPRFQYRARPGKNIASERTDPLPDPVSAAS